MLDTMVVQIILIVLIVLDMQYLLLAVTHELN